MRPCSPWILLALAGAVRAVVAIRTAVPGRDSAGYLWLADQVAERGPMAAFESGFHPLYPLLVALVPGDTVAAGQIVSCGLGALAVLPLFAVARRMYGQRAAVATAFLYAVGIWFARHPADCLSEGPFYLWVAMAVWVLSQERPVGWVVGLSAGLAFATRPEGASLILVGVPWLWLGEHRRAAIVAGVVFAAAVLLCSVGFWLGGMGFVVTPKLVFNYEVGIGQAGQGFGYYLAHLAQVPGELCEALGYVATPMALLGLWIARPWRVRSPLALVLALVALQIAVIPLLRSHFRFLSGYGFLLLVFAGLAWREMQPKLAKWPAPLRVAIICLAVGGDLVRIPQPRRGDRRVVVELGEWLAPLLHAGSKLVTEMIPRLEYFAGMRPAPNRPLTRVEVLEACKPAQVRYAVVVRGRTGITLDDLRQLSFEPAQLPTELQLLVDERRMIVCERRR